MIQLPNKIQLQSSNFWLLIITGLLISLNWHLVKYNSVYLIFWITAFFITWRNRKNIYFSSDLISTSLGLLLVNWVLFRCVFCNNTADVLARLYPLVSTLGIYFLASNFTKITQYWREISIVSLTSIPFEHLFVWLSSTEKMSILDAKLSRIILWYLGFDVYQKDNFVFLPQGSIQIAGSCSSFDLLWLMVQFCIVIYLCFSLKIHQKILLGFWSTVIALGINGVRLCLMALLVANSQQEAFKYWHGSNGAEIFTTIAILLFALVYWLLTRQQDKDIGKLYES